MTQSPLACLSHGLKWLDSFRACSSFREDREFSDHLLLGRLSHGWIEQTVYSEALKAIPKKKKELSIILKNNPGCARPMIQQFFAWFWGQAPLFPGGADNKESVCNARDPDSIPALGRYSGGGNGYPLQYSCLENPTDRGAWWATVHGATKSQTWLNG